MDNENRQHIRSIILNPILLMGFIGCFTFGASFASNLYLAFGGPKDIWWTHMSAKMPFDETTRYFQVYISDYSLQGHLDKRDLLLIDNKGQTHPIVGKDITARVNNWNKTKSRYLTIAVFTGFGSGASFALLCVGLIQLLVNIKKYRQKKPTDA